MDTRDYTHRNTSGKEHTSDMIEFRTILYISKDYDHNKYDYITK